MKIKITVARSSAWVNAQTLEQGKNVPKQIEVDVDLSALPVEVRKMLQIVGNFDGTRSFPARWDGGFYKDYEWTTGWGSGKLPPVVDSDQPTVEQIADALLAADVELKARKQAAEAEAARKLAERKAKAEEWAALPLEWRAADDYPGYCRPPGSSEDYRGPLFSSGVVAYAHQDLGEFAPQAWAEAGKECQRRREAKEGKQAIADREILAKFLASFPADALRGALKAYAGKDLPAIRKKIEDASPAVTIFADDDDDDDDDDE